MIMLKRFITTTLQRKNPFDKDAFIKVVSNSATDWKIGATTNNFLHNNSSILDLSHFCNQMVKRFYSTENHIIGKVFMENLCPLKKFSQPKRSKKVRLLLDDSTSILDMSGLKKVHKEIRNKRAKESKLRSGNVLQIKKLKKNLKNNAKSGRSVENGKKEKEDDDDRLHCTPKYNHQTALCPPVKKTDGCIRVKYSNCLEPYKFGRKYSSVREREYNVNCRIKAPHPCFVECAKPFIYVIKPTKCDTRSNHCEEDWRVKGKPPKTMGCG